MIVVFFDVGVFERQIAQGDQPVGAGTRFV